MKAQNIAASSQRHREFNKKIVNLCGEVERIEGLSTSEALSTWINLLAASLKSQTYRALNYIKLHEKHEAEYMSIVGRLRDKKKSCEIFVAMTAEFIAAMEEQPGDILGPMFMEAFASANLGQFFTPASLSETIAMQTLPANPEEMIDKDYITILEPSCGVGGMVMAGHKVMIDRGIVASLKAIWTAVDVDNLAANCAYIQMSLGGVSGIVVWGNTLSGETFDAWPTITLAMTRPHLIVKMLKSNNISEKTENL